MSVVVFDFILVADGMDVSHDFYDVVVYDDTVAKVAISP